jgi:hypothetical protein
MFMRKLIAYVFLTISLPLNNTFAMDWQQEPYPQSEKEMSRKKETF